MAGWKMQPLKIYFLLNMGIFPACYVSLPEGNPPDQIGIARRVVREIHDVILVWKYRGSYYHG